MSTTDPGPPGAASSTSTAGTAARKAARGAAPAPAGSRRRRSGSTAGASAAAGAQEPRADRATRRQLDPDALAALEEEREFLLTSLDDLEREHDAGDVDDDDYAELKDDYTARTAAVLRAIEERHAVARRARAPRSWTRLAAWATLVVLLAVAGGVLVARSSGNRPPGGQASGDVRSSSRDLLLEAQQYTGQATQQLQDGDPEAALASYQRAIEAYQRVLEVLPTNAEALTYQGWVLNTIAVNVGDDPSGAELRTQALVRLDEAIAANPGYPDARVFRAIILRNLGRTEAARADLAAVGDDEVPAFMRDMVTSLRQSLGAPPG